MKKNRIIAFVGVCAFLLVVTGCNTKESKLVCKQTANGVDITFNVGFKGNTIAAMDFDYDMDLSSYTDEQIGLLKEQDFCTSVKAAMSSYKDAFTDCKQNITDKHLKVSSVLDVDKIAKNILDKMTTPAKTKKELEKEGYKCTVK